MTSNRKKPAMNAPFDSPNCSHDLMPQDKGQQVLPRDMAFDEAASELTMNKNGLRKSDMAHEHGSNEIPLTEVNPRGGTPMSTSPRRRGRKSQVQKTTDADASAVATAARKRGNRTKPCDLIYDDFFMRRAFFPVGQGAFYCERFYAPRSRVHFTMVYDCGVLHLPAKRGSRKNSKLRDNFNHVIERHFPDGAKSIDALYISHLDSDHVSGLELLAEHKIEAKNFFLPAIDTRDRWLVEMWLELTDPNGLALKIFRDQNVLLSMFPAAKIHTVPITASSDDPGSPLEPVNSDKTIGDVDTSFDCGPFSDWVFSPFNLRSGNDIATLLQKLATAFHVTATAPNLNDAMRMHWRQKGKFTEIKKIYREVLGDDFNANSTTLYSGPRWSELWQGLVCCRAKTCGVNPHLSLMPAGGLYMGDYNAASNYFQLLNFYSKRMRWDNIGCVQVPHHGACTYFNTDLLKLPAIFVASAGLSRQYGHPDRCVQLACHQAPRPFFCVTEHAASCLCTTVTRMENHLHLRNSAALSVTVQLSGNNNWPVPSDNPETTPACPQQ